MRGELQESVVPLLSAHYSWMSNSIDDKKIDPNTEGIAYKAGTGIYIQLQ